MKSIKLTRQQHIIVKQIVKINVFGNVSICTKSVKNTTTVFVNFNKKAAFENHNNQLEYRIMKNTAYGISRLQSMSDTHKKKRV